MTKDSSQNEAVAKFRALHESGCFILPNPWDIGSAVYLHHLEFKALATTSAGFAFSRGRADGKVERDEMLAHICEVAAATPLPVNADFLGGFAVAPADVAANVKLCVSTGVAGLSIEDSTGVNDPLIFEEQLAVERIRAARAAIDETGVPVVLTARCEAWLVGHPDPFQVASKRLAAYAAAGADCLYAPSVRNPREVGELVKIVAPKPLNLLMSRPNPELSFARIAELGVRRISVGSALALVAWGEFTRAAREMAQNRSFDSLAEAASFAELNELFAERS